MSATVNTTHRLDLIKDIADEHFDNDKDVVLLSCPNYPIITSNAQQYSQEHDVYATVKEFLHHRLSVNNNSLDKMIAEMNLNDMQKLGFNNAKELVDNFSDVVELGTKLNITDEPEPFNPNKCAFDITYDILTRQYFIDVYELLARQYGAVYLKSLVKISILTSASSLDDLAKLAKMAGKQNDPSGLLFCLCYTAKINRPMSYQLATKLAKNKCVQA